MGDKNLKQFKAEQQKLEFTITDPSGQAIDLEADNVEEVHLDVATHVKEFGETQFEKVGNNLQSDGSVEFELMPSDTEELATGNYIYEVWVEFASSNNYVAEVGKFFIKPRADR